MLERIVDDITGHGWSVAPDFLPQDAIVRLAKETRQLSQNGGLRPAAIGKGGERSVNPGIRSDSIHWLEEDSLTPPQRLYFDRLEELRLAANRYLQLGLFEFEGHLAAYPPGTFYRKHIDRFQNDSLRTLTTILYLNPDWRTEDGGQMRLYLDGEQFLDVLPQGGILVTFLSDRFWHEVLPAKRERLSLTGWFKTRGGGMS